MDFKTLFNVKVKIEPTDEDYHISNETGIPVNEVYLQRKLVESKRKEFVQHGDEPVCLSYNNTGFMWKLVDGMATAIPCQCGRANWWFEDHSKKGSERDG